MEAVSRARPCQVQITQPITAQWPPALTTCRRGLSRRVHLSIALLIITASFTACHRLVTYKLPYIYDTLTSHREADTRTARRWPEQSIRRRRRRNRRRRVRRSVARGLVLPVR